MMTFARARAVCSLAPLLAVSMAGCLIGDPYEGDPDLDDDGDLVDPTVTSLAAGAPGVNGGACVDGVRRFGWMAQDAVEPALGCD